MPYDLIYMWNLKKKRTNVTKLSHRYREQTRGFARRKKVGESKETDEGDYKVYSLLKQ